MVLRNIVIIDEEKCDGCGQCVNACAEGAIEIIDGKAKLVSEIYCDGLGACLGHCPRDAITIEKRQADQFDEEATHTHLAKEQQARAQADLVCPGMTDKKLREKSGPASSDAAAVPSQLTHWPVQLKLVSPQASCFADADLLLVADCVPFAMGDFHNKFLKEHSVVVGCPKLDNADFYIEKLAVILKANKLNSLTLLHMEVPCCFGLTHIARQAITSSGVDIAFEDITISLDGNVKKRETIS
ncbi:MAG: 4Fe-4S dicluster domain-containing protein [Planctomycetes bacterium]|nr:4Fe-4S dicluster domain-containing protein [Planctomycetota bacterium]